MKKKIKLKNLIIFIIFVTCFITFIFSLINIFSWLKDSKATKQQANDIQDKIIINEKENSVEIIEQEKIDEYNPYWNYIKMNLIDVNFNELKDVNNDVSGWIQVNGTNINYPFVQTTDNSFYLNHSFNKKSNKAGWVFLDYRNNLYNEDKNLIIYAHGRGDKTMFGTLKNILTNGWLSKKENYVVKLSTAYENTLWQIFSVYHIPTTSDYIQIEFSNDEKFEEFANMLLNRSAYDFNTTVSSTDRILTLSTCYNKTDKVVLHAKLIKREVK